MSDRYVVRRLVVVAEGSIADCAQGLQSLEPGQTATLTRRVDPSATFGAGDTVTIARAADGWVVHAEQPEAPWVAILRWNLSNPREEPT